MNIIQLISNHAENSSEIDGAESVAFSTQKVTYFTPFHNFHDVLKVPQIRA